jgi:acyl-CoA reductase-like NAD-dependent aldehyde dehydrogenase
VWLGHSQLREPPSQAFDTEAEAVALVNNSTYGLSASVWSENVDRPMRIARRLESGTIWINNWAVVYDETEEGGYKQSGLGRLTPWARDRLRGRSSCVR